MELGGIPIQPYVESRKSLKQTLLAIALVLLAVVLVVSTGQQIRNPATPAEPTAVTTSASGPSANLDQCRNGGVGATPVPCNPITTSPLGWVNGNAGGSQAHWREGESIAYRTILEGLTAGTEYVLDFHYDTVHSAKHAIDYLTSYDVTETTSSTPTTYHANNINPCSDYLSTANCVPASPASFILIPIPNLVSCGGSAGVFGGPIVADRYIKAYGPTGTVLSSVTYPAQDVASGTGQCSTDVEVTFIAGGPTVILAWGGHIASQANWGFGNSASAISGSPYHMALDLLNGASTGAQDRSLAASAIFFTPTIVTTIFDASTDLAVPGTPPTAPAGTTVYDTATLSEISPLADGTVYYAFFNNGVCSGTPASNESVTVTDTIVPKSPNHGPLAPGSYSFQAYYGGDSQNNVFPAKSACEPLTIVSVAPTITTSVSPSTLTLGPSPVSATDTATISGGVNPTGTVIFTVYYNDLTCAAGSLKFTSDPITVSGDGSYTSTPAFVPDAAGTYYWIASYSGDINNEPVETSCGESGEILVVEPASPDVTTAVSQAYITLGDSTFSVTDTATLSGAFYPTGSITFTVFNSASCSGTALFSSTKPVSGNGAYTSDPFTIPGVGTYYWIASYSGDGNNNPFATKCGEANEVVHVSPASPILTTVASPSQFQLTTTSTPVTDTATLSGGFQPTGFITFTLYFDDATCADGNLVFTSNAIAVTGNGAYTSTPTYTPLAAGTYYWIAAYAGDGNNNAYTTHCGEDGEVLTVLPASPGVTTVVSPSSIVLGDGVYTATDTAYLTGGYNPTGSITFTVFDTAGCSGTPIFSSTKPVSGDGAYTSDSFTVPGVGTYYWIADYSGDDNNNAFTTGCGDSGEVLTVTPASPTVSTLVSPSTITLGNDPPYTAFDTATLSGAFDPTGSITFTVYFDDATCSAAPVFTSTVPVSGNAAYPSATMTVTAAGTYYWVAAYSGDANNNPFTTACSDPDEVLIVYPASPSMTTLVSPATFQLTESSQPVTDTATLSGGFNPTGSITFYVYYNDVSCGAGNLVFTSSPVPVSGNGPYTSTPAFTPDAAGTYYWIASYTGDPNNDGFTTGCGDPGETLVVEPAQPGITTLVSQSSFTLGDSTFTVTDSATLSGAFDPIGTITFNVYNSAGCTGTSLFTSTKTVSGNGVYTSDPFTIPAAGTYFWIAHYSGDSNNEPYTTTCGEAGEVVTVSPASPSLTTVASPSQFQLTTTSTPVTDTATLSGGFQPTGFITFTLYFDDDTCGAGSLVFTSNAIPVSGNGDYTSAPTYTPTAAGTYYWIASYSGDPNNVAVTTGCGDLNEVVTVIPASPTLVTSPSPKTQTLTTVAVPVTDTATLSGGFEPTGTITFQVFAVVSGTCSGGALATSTATVDGNGAYTSAPFTPPSAGTYVFVVTYSGDPNNDGFGPTSCSDTSEQFTVSPSSPSGSTAVSIESFALTTTSTPVTDTATISGGYFLQPSQIFGTLTFNVYLNDGTCTGNPVFTSGPFTVDHNGAYVSDPFTPLQVGVYTWRIVYTGDLNNNGFTNCGGDHETVTVTPASPSGVTALSLEAFALTTTSTAVTDTATVSNGYFLQPGQVFGTLTFNVYLNDGTCTGNPVFTSGPFTVDHNGGYLSDPFTANQVGTYTWQIVYTGDLNNNGFTNCGGAHEVLTVTPASPTATTAVSIESFALTTTSTPVTDTATFSGGFFSPPASPSGTLTFYVYYNDASCGAGNLVFTSSSLVVDHNGAYISDAFTPTAVGVYTWQIVYTGDLNNDPFAICGGAHETVTVTPAAPSATTEVSIESFALTTTSTAVTDTASFTGGFFSPPASPSGTLTFYVYYNDASCGASSLVFASSPLVVDHNDLYTSDPFTPTAAGVYTWQIVYTGDLNNAPFTICGGDHETVTVLPASPTITTALSQETLTLTTVSAPVTDTATLSGGYFLPPASPSGTITFRVYYNDASCGAASLVFTSSSIPVSSNGPYVQTPAFTPTAVGTYYWIAQYTGDLNNNPFVTACGADHEVLVVSPASPSATTEVSIESFELTTVSQAVTDTATFTGGFFSPPASPSGTLTFYVYYNDASCGAANLVFASSSLPVNHNGAYTSDPFTPTAAGVYTWRIVYTGDLNNNAFSICGGDHETVTVNPASPTATTEVSTESIALTTGSVPVTDTATFSGGYFSPPASPSGTLTFYVYYNDASCGAANLVFTSSPLVVDHNGAYTSDAFTPTAVGTYTWRIVYTGDLNNDPFSICGGPHETVTVTAATPSATTEVSIESFALTTTSTAVTDTASFTGGFFSPPASPSGTLTFYVYYNDATCDGSNLVFASSALLVDHNGLYTSDPFTPLAVGTYTWQIVYTGDLNNAPFSICGGPHETITVTPSSPSATTEVSLAEFALTTTSTPVTDTATFVGGYFLQPSQVFGTLTFNVYLNDGSCSGTPVFTSGPFTVDHNGNYLSGAFTADQVGVYTWQIVYTGDLNNNGFTNCGGANEVLTVTPSSPSGTTLLSIESFQLTAASQPVTDTATISGGFFLQPSQIFGTLTFNVYLNSGTCTGVPVFTSGPFTVDHNGLYTSAPFTPPQVGVYTWQIVYTGDLNNNGFTNCGGAHEVLTVTPASPSGETAVSIETFALTTDSMPVTDTATISGGYFLQPSQVFGTLTFNVYLNDGTCTGNPVFTSGPFTVDHNGDYTSAAFTPLQVGTYTWQIVYTGDLNNNGFTNCGGAHETVIVTPASPSGVTVLSIESFQLTTTSTPVTDTATISGGFFLQPGQVFGTLTFNVYRNDGTCTGTPVFSSGPFAVDHNGDYLSGPFTATQVGVYTWQIVYTGDLNNNGFTNCGGDHEVLTVLPASPSVVTAVSAETITLGDSTFSVTDTATLSGGFNPTGSITFDVYGDASCSGTSLFTSTKTVGGNGAYTSDPFTIPAAGTYYWIAHYSGDPNNNPFTTNCGEAHEVVTVHKAPPPVTTEVSTASIILSDGTFSVTDTATLTGGFDPTGSITFNVYNSAGCTGSSLFTSTVTVDGNGPYTSDPFTIPAAGTYFWIAHYSGDGNNLPFTTQCGEPGEVVTVSPASPLVVTAVSTESITLGDSTFSVTDTATLSGGFAPTGSILFSVYNTVGCTGDPLFTSTKTVSGNGAYTSDPYTIPGVGTYRWIAHYSGDGNNDPFTTGCGDDHEVVTVAKAPPNVATVASPSSITLADSTFFATDTATLSGGFQPTGSITFNVYNSAGCTGTSLFTSTKTVSGNGAYTSDAFEVPAAGTYYWIAHYSGDGNNLPFTTGCGDPGEVLTVTPASPEIVTQVSDESITLSASTFSVTDTATLSGGFTPSGSILFSVYDTVGCTGDPLFTSTVPVSGNDDYTSAAFPIPGVGTYSWIASYSGDGNNDPFTTGCGDAHEVVSVTPASPRIVTAVSTASITLSDSTFSVTDTASLSGGFEPTGSITFTVFKSACTGTPLFTSTKTVSGNGDYTSDPYTIPSAGTYFWIAAYSGDGNNDPFATGCGDANEVVTVSPASPEIVTQVSDESITLGDASFSVTDTATLSGGFEPTGSITFQVFGDSLCSGPVLFSDTVTVSGNDDYTSAAFPIPGAGTYYWVASYSGDGNNDPFTTTCGEAHEVVTVAQAPPSVTTAVSDESITLGDSTFSVTDTATLTGGFEPTGSITFNVYNSAGCTGSSLFTSTVTVDGNGPYTSDPFTIPAAGAYYWIAHYSGDDNNLPFTTGCGDAHEVVTVSPATPNVVTALSEESIVLADASFSVTDTATLSGGFSPTGSITFTVFDTASCSGSPLFTSTVPVSGNDDYTSDPFEVPGVGTYYWIAHYSGDGNNDPFTTGCGDDHEVLTVTPASPEMTTALSTEGFDIPTHSTSVTDTATLTGGFEPTGTIQFFVFFDSPTCVGSPVFTSDLISVSGNGAYTSTPGFTPTEEGTYYWIAHYSGDDNNNAFTTGCGDAHEVLTITLSPGTIIVEKVALGGDGTFGYTTTGGSTFPASFDITTTAGAGSATFTGIDVHNTYSVEETGLPASWIPISVSCSDGTSSVDPAGFLVPAGGTVTCTFTNAQLAQLIVIKHVDNSALPADAIHKSASDFTMLVTAVNPSQGSFPGAESPGVTVSVEAGAYSVTESPLDPSYSNAFYTTTYAATFSGCTGTLDWGQTATCTITNTGTAEEIPNAHLTIKKIALGGDGSFTFDLTGPSVGAEILATVTITTSGGLGQYPTSPIDILHGTYTITEELIAGWTLVRVTCTVNGGTPITEANGLSIDVPLGGDVVCTFTNTRSFGQITDTMFCPFDTDSGLAGQQFNVLFTKSGSAYKISATNPGQFYYNVFFYGTPGEDASIAITLPWPFVTQGAQPVHVYSDFGVSSSGCLQQFDDVSSTFAMSGPSTTSSGGPAILLTDYTNQANGNTQTIELEGPVPSTGLAYVTVHIMWGLNGTGGWQPVGPCSGGCVADAHNSNGEDLPNNYAYGFAWSESGTGTAISNTVNNKNVFKN